MEVVFDAYFRVADLDRGVQISGQEAVTRLCRMVSRRCSSGGVRARAGAKTKRQRRYFLSRRRARTGPPGSWRDRHHFKGRYSNAIEPPLLFCFSRQRPNSSTRTLGQQPVYHELLPDLAVRLLTRTDPDALNLLLHACNRSPASSIFA